MQVDNSLLAPLVTLAELADMRHPYGTQLFSLARWPPLPLDNTFKFQMSSN